MSATLFAGGGVPASPRLGQSDEALRVRREFEETKRGTSETITLGRQADAWVALFDACADATTIDWNGPGTEPVDLQTYLNAERFTTVLPTSVPVPEISVASDGEIQFEWYAGHRRLFAVSVGPSDIFHYAGMRGSEKFHGAIRFVDGFPGKFLTFLMSLGF